jgi:hypothetical protein
MYSMLYLLNDRMCLELCRNTVCAQVGGSMLELAQEYEKQQ